MDQNIKHRLVGIAVIFALAVIFLPMILDGGGVRDKTLKVEIPEQPIVIAPAELDEKIIRLSNQVDELTDLEPGFIDETSAGDAILTKPEDVEPVAAIVVQPVEAESEPVVEPKIPVGGQSWVLQVGSFQDRSKALSQRDKLRQSKIAAVFVEKFSKSNKTSYRVRLGPFINRDQSTVAQNKVLAKYNIDGLIMKYEH
ncbi:MAG: hypothetical protein GY784_13925 [Gammaproteobacteria bacterium]|nr:hypothetical protein [Gammaproteobacteria bacterium]